MSPQTLFEGFLKNIYVQNQIFPLSKDNVASPVSLQGNVEAHVSMYPP